MVSKLCAPLFTPFRTALGQHDSLDNLLLVLELPDGTRGYGEAAVASHITGETISQTEKNLKSAGLWLEGRDIFDYLKISSQLHERLADNKSALAAAETAIFDLLSRYLKIPLWRLFGKKPQRLATDITIVISDLAQTETAALKFYSQGFRAFKIKIGRDRDLDYKRVLRVKKIVKGSAIYLDANQGYSASETLSFLRSLKRAGINPLLIEQPVPKTDWEGLKKVTRESSVLVCADESVGSVKECLKAIREKAVDVINIKLMKSGMVQAREIAFLAKSAGLEIMIGGMMESSLAMTASAHLACGLGGVRFVDLDTPFFIKNGLKGNPFLNSRGIYDLAKVKFGIGIVPE